MGIFRSLFKSKSKESSNVKSNINAEVVAKDNKVKEVEKKINIEFNEFNNKYRHISNKGNMIITINGEEKSVVSFNERMFNNDTICIFIRHRKDSNAISEHEEIVDFLYKKPNKRYEYYSIKVCDINHYEIIGEYHRDMKITGGTVSGGDYDIKKSAVGYAVGGAVGAVIAGKNKVTSEPIKTSYDVTDNRETVLYYTVCDIEKKIIMPKEAYDSLKVIIPEKDIKNSAFKTRATISEEIRKVENEQEQRRKALNAKDQAINSKIQPIIDGVLGELKSNKDGLTIGEIKNIVNGKYRNEIQAISDVGGNVNNITQKVLLRARANGVVKISDESLHNYDAIVTFVEKGERDKAKKERKNGLKTEKASALSKKYIEDVKLLRGKYKKLSDNKCVISDRKVRETILDTDLITLVQIIYGDVRITDNHKIKIEIIQNLLHIKAPIRNLFDYKPLEYSDTKISSCMRELVKENIVERFEVMNVVMFKIKKTFIEDLYKKIKES